MSATTQGPVLSPTTGEPVATVARRNRVGIWLCIVSDVTGVVALLIAYAYLWSLNVNDGWAPPNNSFAPPLLFWVIAIGGVLTALLLWWGALGVQKGNRGTLMTAGVLALIICIATFVIQIVQLSTFPFGPSDGAYASATFWLALGAAFHLSLVMFLITAVVGRTARGLITPANPSHARLVAMYSTWAAIAIILGAFFATTMTTSPNVNSPTMGGFGLATTPANQPPASPAASAPAAAPASAPAASSAPSPSAS